MATDMKGAHSPAARAKRAATMAAKKAAKAGTDIPLDAIPGDEPKKRRRKAQLIAPRMVNRTTVVLEIIRLAMLLTGESHA